MIPYGHQDINQDDIDAVVEVLQSDFLTQGPVVPRFEQTVAAYCQARHAVAVNSATSALHLACRALGLGPGDWLWTSPITFVASANCALYCGAQVDFVDIEPETALLSIDALADKLEQAEKNGCLPKIVVPVHFAGQPCDMQEIHALGQRYGFHIIEDAAHAIGARYQGEPVGNCRYSDITVFSFHPVKIITTGEGGMALANDEELAEKMRLLRSHGITRDPDKMTRPPDGPWYYEQIDLGYNYRMTDIQAALGISQMARLDEFLCKRRALVVHYLDKLANLPLQFLEQKADRMSAWHLFIVRLQHPQLSRKEIFLDLQKQGIGVQVHYIPVYRQPYYQKKELREQNLLQADMMYRQMLSLPLYPALLEIQQNKVIASLQELLNAKS